MCIIIIIIIIIIIVIIIIIYIYIYIYIYIKTFHLLLVQLNGSGKAFSQNCWHSSIYGSYIITDKLAFLKG